MAATQQNLSIDSSLQLWQDDGNGRRAVGAPLEPGKWYYIANGADSAMTVRASDDRSGLATYDVWD